MDFWGITDSGKVRKHNQDAFKTLSNEDNSFVVLVVCDGIGGANAGNVASEMAADTFMTCIKNEIGVDGVYSQEDIAEIVKGAVSAANKSVYEKSKQGEEFTGMGTTITAAVSTTGGEVVANIGDSRLYHITDNKITQITKDHSVVEDMIEKGEITRGEARRHASRNLITRALGAGDNEPPDIFFMKLNDGESILLCSDGLTDVVLDSEIQFELLRGKSARESCEALLETALERGAPDNVTAVILKK